jgi:hypothetical protein
MRRSSNVANRLKDIPTYLLVSLLLLCGRQSAAQSSGVTEPTNAPPAHNAAVAIRVFLLKWRSAWVASEAERHPITDNLLGVAKLQQDLSGNTRFLLPNQFSRNPIDTTNFSPLRPVHRFDNTLCSTSPALRRDSSVTTSRPERVVGAGRQILSENVPAAVCPTWYLGPERNAPWDEAVALDNALSANHRASARANRSILIAHLDSLHRQHPTDNFIYGQLIRFLTDQGDTTRAFTQVSLCQASAMWCHMLRGYVMAWSGDHLSAEKAFEMAELEMTSEMRCSWTSVEKLVSGQSRAAYLAMPCHARDSVTRTVWWLADPLWSKPGNDRKVEHFKRRVLLLLRAGLQEDERFSWHPSFGNDAREEMVLRYGWPSMVYWRGFTTDSLYSRPLTGSRADSGYFRPSPGGIAPSNTPYVSYEYARGRTSLFPKGNVLGSPLLATADSWEVHAPAGGDTVIHWKPPNTYHMVREFGDLTIQVSENQKSARRWRDEAYRRFADSTLWWPGEHYAAPRAIVQLPDPTIAYLRRQDSIEVVVAVPSANIRTGSIGRFAAKDIALIYTTSPNDQQIHIGALTIAQDIIVRATVPTGRALIGLEFSTQGEGADARIRTSIATPSSLSSMRADEAAMSDLHFLHAPQSGNLPHSPDSLLARFSAASHLESNKRIALYWETYGLGADDSVSFSLRVVRTSPTSGARQFAARLRIGTADLTSGSIRWSERRPSRAAIISAGPVPVVARSVIVGTEYLTKGDYLLELTMESGNTPAITITRKLVVH